MLAILSLLVISGSQLSANWTIDIKGPQVEVSPHLYGIFFEEINCSGDGGIYAEMVRNRGFEDSDKPDHWAMRQGSGQIALTKDQPISDASPTSLRVDATDKLAIENEGYWGYGVQSGEAYEFALSARGDGGDVRVGLVSDSGKTLAEETISLRKGGWGQYRSTLRPTSTEPKAKLVLTFDKPGNHRIDMVSLFPKKTWKGRANGMRPDLLGLLDGLKPGFMRFPGGCWVEGETMALSQRWKQTVGDLSERRTQHNIWGYESTNGLGYHEYLQMCEDLGAAPLFVINCGMSHREVVPMDKMDEYVQDALDAIEYANGPTTTRWGALRAKNGHARPFGLKYMEIGNENGGAAYEERYGLMYKAIKAKYPEIDLIACVWGGTPKKTPTDIIDEHYYSNPEFFAQNANRYDNYDRKGPKVYVGEYAVTQGVGNGNLRGALGEAAFMTGMERNSDIVTMSSYAPLFANVNHITWNPDLIYYDNSRVIGTPSYYVQKLFAQNRADVAYAAKPSDLPSLKRKFPDGAVGVGTWNTRAEFKDIKVTQGDKVLFESADGSGLKPEAGSWSTVDGAYRQSGDNQPARATFGDAKWRNYTVTLKARKISGAEGFMITVGQRGRGDYLWWNVGGWGNREHGIELATGGGKSVIGRQVAGSVEVGKWYDLKIEYTEDKMRCFLDGKLIQEQELLAINPLHAVAGFDKSKSTAILKIVNVSNDRIVLDVDLSSTGWKALKGTWTILTGDNEARNTLEKPSIVSPVDRTLSQKAARFNFQVEPRSLNILKLTRSN